MLGFLVGRTKDREADGVYFLVAAILRAIKGFEVFKICLNVGVGIPDF